MTHPPIPYPDVRQAIDELLALAPGCPVTVSYHVDIVPGGKSTAGYYARISDPAGAKEYTAYADTLDEVGDSLVRRWRSCLDPKVIEARNAALLAQSKLNAVIAEVKLREGGAS